MSERKRVTASGHLLLRYNRSRWYMRLRLPSVPDTTKAIGKAWHGPGRPPEGYFTRNTAQEILDSELQKYQNMTQGNNPLFSVAADEYIEHLRRNRNLRESTLRRYTQICKFDLKPALGDLRLAEISRQRVIALRDELASRAPTPRGPAGEHKTDEEQTRISGSTLNQTRTLLVGIFKFAKRARGYTGSDPSEEFDRAPIKPKSHIDVFSPAEVLALARAATTEQDSAIFLVAAFSGLRRSELRALHWRDIDFAKSTIFVRGGYTNEGGYGLTKSGRGRSVPMIDQAAKALEELSRREHFTQPDDLVFCTTLGGVIEGSALYRRYRRTCKRAGLRELRLHDLRHTAISMWVQIWPLSEVQAYAGHANISTTMIYAHHQPRANAAEKLGAFVDAEIGLSEMPLTTDEGEREGQEVDG